MVGGRRMTRPPAIGYAARFGCSRQKWLRSTARASAASSSSSSVMGMVSMPAMRIGISDSFRRVPRRFAPPFGVVVPECGWSGYLPTGAASLGLVATFLRNACVRTGSESCVHEFSFSLRNTEACPPVPRREFVLGPLFRKPRTVPRLWQDRNGRVPVIDLSTALVSADSRQTDALSCCQRPRGCNRVGWLARSLIFFAGHPG